MKRSPSWALVPSKVVMIRKVFVQTMNAMVMHFQRHLNANLSHHKIHKSTNRPIMKVPKNQPIQWPRPMIATHRRPIRIMLNWAESLKRYERWKSVDAVCWIIIGPCPAKTSPNWSILFFSQFLRLSSEISNFCYFSRLFIKLGRWRMKVSRK